MKKEMKTIIVQSILLIFQICVLLYILSIYKKIDDIDHELKNIKNNTASATEEVKRAIRYYTEEIQTSIYESYLPSEDECLHPYGKFNKGIFDGPYGRESYYTIMSYVLDDMRDRGYSEEDYPYWVREDGVEMLGDYVIVAANIEKAPYGTIVSTSLGDGIVCDMTGLSFGEDPENCIDISTQWR